MNDVEQIIRDAHKSLVCAAEKVIREAFGVEEKPRPSEDSKDDGNKRPNSTDKILVPEKSQLNHLAALCNEASCKEEIVNFIQYQVGRKSAPWPREFAELVIEGIEEPLEEIRKQAKDADVNDEPALSRIEARAWGRYVVFLTRAYTYQDKVRKDKKDQHGKAGDAGRKRS